MEYTFMVICIKIRICFYFILFSFTFSSIHCNIEVAKLDHTTSTSEEVSFAIHVESMYMLTEQVIFDQQSTRPNVFYLFSADPSVDLCHEPNTDKGQQGSRADDSDACSLASHGN